MSLWDVLTAGGPEPAGSLCDALTRVRFSALARHSIVGDALERLRGRVVILAVRDQLAAALALLELDGLARRLVVCPPDLSPAHIPAVIEISKADAWLCDSSDARSEAVGLEVIQTQALAPFRWIAGRLASHQTEWILFTSGTTGAPKLVLHSLASLTHAIVYQQPPAAPIVWSTFYDIRRYGGLQVFLRAVRTGSLVLTREGESLADFLARAGAAGVTHVSGTPSHWRRVLMSGAASKIAPRYVRLSGEIADQPILDRLRAAYPTARVAHAFASTEAGVAFEVGDGLAGFPASLSEERGERVAIRVSGGTLRIRSAANAARYLGADSPPLKDSDGYIDTGDRVELRDGRYHFVGRSGGVINVGGLKVHPEEVEAVINTHPRVRMSLVKARHSPITGAVVTADIVLTELADGSIDAADENALRREITETCRSTLASHKVPAMLRFVPALAVSPSGKLVRPGA